MELILANCKLPQNCVNKAIGIIYIKKNFELLQYLEANLVNMKEIIKFMYNVNSKYIPTNNFLATLYFTNLYEFWNYIINLYEKDKNDLDRLCTTDNIHIGSEEIELIEKWLLDGRLAHNVCNYQIYDFIYENYPENFGKSFSFPEYYWINNMLILKISSEYNLKNLRKYLEVTQLDFDTLYTNNYLTPDLYEKYYPKIVEKSSPEFFYAIELFNCEEQYQLVFQDNRSIFGKGTSYYFIRILKKIGEKHIDNINFVPISYKINLIRTYWVTKHSLDEINNYIDTLVDDDTNFIVYDTKDYIELKDIPSNVFIYDSGRHSESEPWSNNILHNLSKLIDITDKTEFISIIQIQELNDVIIYLDGNYQALNELWVLSKLKCTKEPIPEIINVFNQMINDTNKETLLEIVSMSGPIYYAVVAGGIYSTDLIT